jgi:hypothetical protein
MLSTPDEHNRDNEQDVWVSLKKVALVIGIASAIAVGAGSFFVFPYRLDAAEKRIETLEQKLAADHETLVRIEVKLDQLREMADGRWPMADRK